MPAALCGVVGLKPTYGRIPHLGVLPLNWTVGMVGVLAATVEDALIVYAAISEHLLTDQLVSFPPHIRLPLLKNDRSVTNLKLAKYTEWFEYCDVDIKNTCCWALNLLQYHYGCKTLEVTLPELEEMRLAHYITIGCECDASFGVDFAKLGMARSGGDTRIALYVYKSFSSREFLIAQRIRSRQMYIHMEIFKKANVIVTPTTGVTAYRLQEDALSYGEFDYSKSAAMLRFQVAGNFLGLPAVTVPIGYDRFGMPIGIQFIGRPWSEATLLHLACVTEVSSFSLGMMKNIPQKHSVVSIRNILVEVIDKSYAWGFFDGSTAGDPIVCGAGELCALKLLLILAQRNSLDKIQIFEDSQLVINWASDISIGKEIFPQMPWQKLEEAFWKVPGPLKNTVQMQLWKNIGFSKHEKIAGSLVHGFLCACA